MRSSLPVKNNHGMSIALIMGVMVILGLAIGTVTTLQRNAVHSLRQMNVRTIAQQIKQRVVAVVLSPDSWQLTQVRNPQAFASFSASAGSNVQSPSTGGASTVGGITGAANMDVSNATPVSKAEGVLLDLYMPGSSNPYYASSVSTAGFDFAADNCKGFDPLNGNDKCPFRVEVRLKNRYQQNALWVDVVSFKMLFKPHRDDLVFKYNGSDFSFDIVRNLNIQSVEASCVALGGTFSSGQNICTVSFSQEVKCSGTSQGYRGPASGDCAARVVTPAKCLAGQAIRGFDSKGNPICANAI